MLYLVVGVTAFVGALACGIGLLVTIPWSLLMFAYGYDRITRDPDAP